MYKITIIYIFCRSFFSIFQISYVGIGIWLGLIYINELKIKIFFNFVMGYMLFNVFLSLIGMIKLYINIERDFESREQYFNWIYSQKFFVYKKIIFIIESFLCVACSIFLLYYFNNEKNIFTKLYVILFTIISISKFIAIIIVEPMTIYKIILLHQINNNELELHSITRNIQAPNQECCICLQIESEKEWASLKCNHEFHYECINQWILLKNNCPICRC